MGIFEQVWEWRSRRAWLVMAALFTILPCLSFVSREAAHWLGTPHTWGGRVAVWSGAAFFWLLYIIRPTRRNVALTMAIAMSVDEIVLVLNRLSIIREGVARPNFEIVGIGALALLFWILHFRSRMVAQP